MSLSDILPQKVRGAYQGPALNTNMHPSAGKLQTMGDGVPHSSSPGDNNFVHHEGFPSLGLDRVGQIELCPLRSINPFARLHRYALFIKRL